MPPEAFFDVGEEGVGGFNEISRFAAHLGRLGPASRWARAAAQYARRYHHQSRVTTSSSSVETGPGPFLSGLSFT